MSDLSDLKCANCGMKIKKKYNYIYKSAYQHIDDDYVTCLFSNLSMKEVLNKDIDTSRFFNSDMIAYAASPITGTVIGVTNEFTEHYRKIKKNIDLEMLPYDERMKHKKVLDNV